MPLRSHCDVCLNRQARRNAEGMPVSRASGCRHDRAFTAIGEEAIQGHHHSRNGRTSGRPSKVAYGRGFATSHAGLFRQADDYDLAMVDVQFWRNPVLRLLKPLMRAMSRCLLEGGAVRSSREGPAAAGFAKISSLQGRRNAFALPQRASTGWPDFGAQATEACGPTSTPHARRMLMPPRRFCLHADS